MPGDTHVKTITPKTRKDYRSVKTTEFLKAKQKPNQSDSWYSWVIAISCMMVIAGTFGIFRTSGVIFAEVIHTYHVDREMASWPFAVFGILNCFSGIVSGPMTTVLSVRVIVIMSICGAAFGLGMCSFTSGIFWMTVGYGFFFGLGTGLAYVCLPMVINDYFKKNKSTGNGILLAGTPLGVTVLALVSEILITTYALRGTFLILSAICVQTLVFAALMKPAKLLLTRGCDVPNYSKHCEDLAEETEMLNFDSNVEGHSTSLIDVNYHSIIQHSKPENGLSDLETSYPSVMKKVDVLVKPSLKSESIELDCIENFGQTDFEHASTNVYQKIRSNFPEIVNVRTEVISPNFELITSSTPEDNEINAAVVSNVNEPKERLLNMKKIMNILRDPIFLLITFNFVVTLSAIQIVTNVLVDYAEDKGLSRESAIILITVISVSEFFSRVCSGWITDKGFMGKEYLLIISQIITGAVIFFISFVNGKYALSFLLVFFGVFSSAIMVLLNVFCTDNFQRELLGFVFGIRHASMIIPSLVRPWIVGIFRDSIGSYDYLFQAVGGATALSAFLWAYTLCNNNRREISSTM